MALQDQATYTIKLKDMLSFGLKKAEAIAQKFDQAMGNINKTSAKTESVFGSLVKFNIFGALAQGAGEFISAMVKGGVELEQTRIAFQTMIGTVEGGNKVLKELTQFADVTPFSTEGVQKAGRTLLSFGVSSEELLPTLKVLGDVSAGTGKDLSELGVIYGQIRGAGKLMGQDLLQLINAGFNPLQVMSKKSGKSMAQLKKEMSAGQISFADVQQAFIDATSKGGLFFNLMEKQSKTVGGLWSTLKGKVTGAMASISEEGSGPIKNLLSGLLEVFNFISTRSSQIKEVFRPVIDVFKDFGKEISSVFGGMDKGATITDRLKKAFNALGYVIRFMAPVIRTMLKPMLTIIKYTRQIISVVSDWIARTELAQKILKGFGAAVVGVFTFIKEVVVNRLKTVGDLVTGIFTGDLAKIKSALSSALDGGFTAAGKAGAKAFKESFNTEYKDFFKTDLEAPDVSPVKSLSEFVADNNANSVGGSNSVAKSASSSVSGISSSRPTSINISIEKLVETLSVTSQTLDQGLEEVEEMVTKVLLSSVNDANLAAQ